MSSGLGICAAPDCNERIDQHRTRLGECAHIIPRKVGSHPREDYSTPLLARKQESNLLYLCEKHHKIIDNEEHAGRFTASLLIKWKFDHETWAGGVRKNSLYIPPELKDGMESLIESFQQQLYQKADISASIIGKLIDACRELLDRQLIDDARPLLSQINLFLLDADNKMLSCKADVLNALLMIRLERISEAKDYLLNIIQMYPNEVEPMLDYVEICDSVPEQDIEKERVESLARELDNNHPRLLLIDYSRMYKKQDFPDKQIQSEDYSHDTRLKCRLLCQQSMFCDLEGDIKKRDELVDIWEETLPNSPRPNLFRVLYKSNDILKLSYNTAILEDAIHFLNDEKHKAENKDPLSLRDKISWKLQESHIILRCKQVLGTNEDLSLIRDDLACLIEQCYFDIFVDSILQKLLIYLRLESDQWQAIIEKIEESKVNPSRETVELLFIQALRFNELQSNLSLFVDKYGHEDLQKILIATSKSDAQETANLINSKNNPAFSLMLLQSVNDKLWSLQLAELIEVGSEYQEDLLFSRIEMLEQNNLDKNAAHLITSLSVEKASSYALHTIVNIAYRNQQWDIFISAALRLLEFKGTPSDNAHLNARLAIAYHEQGDDSNAILHAESFLDGQGEIGEKNSEYILHILGQSFLLKGKPEMACEKFEKYDFIKRSFLLSLEEADLYIKSDIADKYDRAFSIILSAFEKEDVYDEKLYLSAFTLLLEIGNSKEGSLKNEEFVEDGLFIKLDGFRDGWFYIGQNDKSLGAECIVQASTNYDAVIHKRISEKIEWPADKFSSNKESRKIIYIVNQLSYLSQRAHEAMDNAARLGNLPIWSIQVINEDGSLDFDNIKKFHDEQFRSNNEFFEKYKTSIIPFSFLCRMEGGLTHALGKIVSERSGFIRCNNNTSADLDAQEAYANQSLNGKPCVIDGLSALMLSQGEFIECALGKIKELYVPTSVIRFLRDVAGKFSPMSGSSGRANFVNGDFQFHPINEENEENLRKKLLQAADFLDSLPNKVVGKTQFKLDDERNLDQVLPEYFVDAFRIAQAYNAYIITDDAYFLLAYGLSGESLIPKNFSSLSLIRSLTNKKLISWEDYLKYFSLLSLHRYHLLPVSVDDLMRTVFTPTLDGVETFTPKNILHMNLQLTLSQEYGVDDRVAAHVLSTFFSEIIQDESIPPRIAEEIFLITITESLGMRDKRLMSGVIYQSCKNNMLAENWLSRSNNSKLKLLNKQLTIYVQEYSPIILDPVSS